MILFLKSLILFETRFLKEPKFEADNIFAIFNRNEFSKQNFVNNSKKNWLSKWLNEDLITSKPLIGVVLKFVW
jgi:hypothetical protein